MAAKRLGVSRPGFDFGMPALGPACSVALGGNHALNDEFDLLVGDGNAGYRPRRRARLRKEPRLTVGHRNGRVSPVRRR